MRSPQVRSPHAFHRTPLSSPPPSTSFSLSLLFLPFVFRGSCCNSADHQQLPFQRHLTLPNPRPSLHPDIANAPPPTRPHPPLSLPCHTERPAEPKPSPPFASSATCPQSYTLFKFKRFPPVPLFCCAYIVVPVCHHMANGYRRNKKSEEKSEAEMSVTRQKR